MVVRAAGLAATDAAGTTAAGLPVAWTVATAFAASALLGGTADCAKPNWRSSEKHQRTGLGDCLQAQFADGEIGFGGPYAERGKLRCVNIGHSSQVEGADKEGVSWIESRCARRRVNSERLVVDVEQFNRALKVP